MSYQPFIRQIDDFLPKSLSDTIENIVCDPVNFPWYFVESASGAEKINGFSNEQYGFYHIVFDGAENSQYFKYFLPIVYFIEDRFSLLVDELMRIRLGLSLKISEENNVRYPHVDTNEKHLTLLYYVNDSDGDTVFYENTENGFIVHDRISPKKNRAVLFDGLVYHSSSTPAKNIKRIALNINFKTNQNY